MQEQLAAQILVPVQEFVGLPAAEPAADAPADAILPLLLGLAAQSQSQLLSPAHTDPRLAAQAEAVIDSIEDASQLPTLADRTAADPGIADPSTAIPLALPAIEARPGLPQEKVGTSDTPQQRSTATTAVKASAILAAAADVGNGMPSAAATKRVEEALLGVASDHAAPRAEMLPHVAAASSRMTDPAARIDAPLGTRQWDGEFANRLVWMAGRQEQRADLVLNPPQLGRIEVSLSVSGDQATAIFTSASATVRDAIENALPRLRETLAESGINLGQAQVGAESHQQSPARDENGDNRGKGLVAGQDARGGATGFAPNPASAWSNSGRGMVDVFV
ncbi:MAG: flagellar hook-length control protein FliK [Gammaproteobacteria bacterium]|nr:flagellar hook-length control protein FliK [Gammaproteobacteria bacterium]